MSKPLKTRLEAGEALLGAWCMIPSALTAEALARAGFDWVLIDMQHGCMDYETALEMIRAVDLGGAAPIVRAPVERSRRHRPAARRGGHGRGHSR